MVLLKAQKPFTQQPDPGDYSFAETLNDNVVTNLNRSNQGVKDDTQSQHDRLAILRDPAGSQSRALIGIEFIDNATEMGEFSP